MTKSKLAKIGILLTFISLLGKFFGLLREVLLAKYFGTSYIVDAYLMSVTIPLILFGWLPAISIGYIPVYYDVEEKKKSKFTSNVLNFTFLIAVIAVVISLIFKKQIIEIAAPGFGKEALSLTINYFEVTIWLVLFNTPIQLLIAYLNCRNMFLFSNITNLCLSMVQAVFVIISSKINIQLLPFGILCSYILQFIMLTLFAKKEKFKYYRTLKVDKYIRKLIPVVIPIFISNSLVDINSFVDKFLASGLVEGSIAALNYSSTLRSFILLVFTTAITTMFYPKISEMVAKNDYVKATIIIEKIISIIILIFIPLTIGAILLSDEIIKCILFRGAFDTKSLVFTKWPFIMFSLSLLFMALRDIIIKILYACKDSKSNLYLGTMAIGMNIVLNLFLIHKLKHVGIALATSLSCILTLPGYIIILKKRFKFIKYRPLLKTSIVSFIASFIMGFVIMLMKKMLLPLYTDSLTLTFLCLMGIVIVGCIIYILFLFILYRKGLAQLLNRPSIKIPNHKR